MSRSITARLQENILFLSRFILTPGPIGSVIPSSRYLARQMVGVIPWDQVNSVAELGAGTGAVTAHIHAVCSPDTKVLLFEKDTLLRDQLKVQYPNDACYGESRDLQQAVRSEGMEKLDVIISGLPFFNFSPILREQIMEQISLALKPGGWFVAFQYSQQMKNTLSDRFEIVKIHFVALNFPPAFVYVCRKRESE